MEAYPTTTVPRLHTEYTVWMDELDFYKEEIKNFEQHLEALVQKNLSHEVLAQVEHFQNAFICQKDVIATLKHNLHISEKQLTAFVRNMSGMGLSSIKMDNHPTLRNEMQTFWQLYKALKNEFRRFEATCL